MNRQHGIFSILEKEHRVITDLLDSISKRARMGKKIEALLGKLHREIETHTLAEEDAIYPKLSRQLEMEEDAAESVEEHARARYHLQKLEGVASTNGEFRTAFEELKNEMEQHIEKEEAEIFPKMQSLFTDTELMKIAEEFQSAKKLQWIKPKAA